MSEDNSLWTKKGATLSDKTAQKEFGLTQEEILDAIKREQREKVGFPQKALAEVSNPWNLGF